MNQLMTTRKPNCSQSDRRTINTKIQHFLNTETPATPCLVVNLDIVAENYLTLRHLMPQAQIYYAMKANPAPEILQLLVGLKAKFDTASIYEIEQCIAAGAVPADISYGNTIKKSRILPVPIN